MPSDLSRSSVVCWSIMLNSEQCGGKNTALFHTICNREGLWAGLHGAGWSWWGTLVGNLAFPEFFQSPCPLTVSNAFVRSMKVTYSALFCSRHFSWICLRINTMSVVTRLALKPHYTQCTYCGVKRFFSPFRFFVCCFFVCILSHLTDSDHQTILMLHNNNQSKSCHSISIGFMSGLWLGHYKTLIVFFFSHSEVDLLVCLVSLSYCITQVCLSLRSSPRPSHYH